MQIESKVTKVGSNIKKKTDKKYIGLLGLSFGNYISKEKLFGKSFASVKKLKFQN